MKKQPVKLRPPLVLAAEYELKAAAECLDLNWRSLRQYVREEHQAGRDCGRWWRGHWYLLGSELSALIRRDGLTRPEHPEMGPRTRPDSDSDEAD